MIELRKVTKENVGRVVALKVRPDQAHFVAVNANSLAEAYVNQPNAWPRAIYAGDEPVGFVMLFWLGLTTRTRRTDGPLITRRFMIGAEHQGKGYGRAAIQAVIEHVKSSPDGRDCTRPMLGDGCPGPFYESA
ncbi:MAG: GNAT family N-acetyltransferase [Phycisphaerales bacterium]